MTVTDCNYCASSRKVQ